ncbi:imidazolonepropionase-like amidohydrolase [Amycolatopsis lexingtonensis]|uniref:Imidazolonepropionase-like amidohydrolase n=1 Tax=Amycolatopsis lexingtonensis TaxID=218822 RepID=A0ABR9I6J1_9PSEU|nr:amidohydrolase family protein [Amycolatopsis lexingtonensis]MBE1498753.1 imidazolonepropionase-like amidohydrolase [Amycolatopsis lexingtonensis]
MDTLITAGRVLPRPSAPVLDGAVLIRDGVIVAAGARADVVAQAAPDAARHDFPTGTALAGLFNVHVHLAFDASREMLAHFSSASDPLEDARSRLTSMLRSGVTTVRDLGDRGHLGAAVRSSFSGSVAPRLLVSGPPITVPDGHCHFFGGAVSSDAAIRALIDENAAAGADVIKVMASGGQITEGGADMWESQFSARELSVVVSHAASHGLPVAAHAHGADAIAAAVSAGVSTVEHCSFLTGPRTFDRRDSVAAQMALAGISACSTSSRNWRVIVEKLGETAAEAMYGRLPWLEEHGVRLLAGTDAGLPGSVFDDPVGALELYEWLGFSRRRILEIATCDSADGLGLSAVTGRLEAGLEADVLVVEGDPLASLSALRNPLLVLARGRAAA